VILGKKRIFEADEKKRLEDQRQKAICFKQFFGTEQGREVMTDLMNKYYILNPLPETEDALALARAEGKRDVVLYLLGRARVDLADLDRILKGEFV
jgi:hypothetical protein